MEFPIRERALIAGLVIFVIVLLIGIFFVYLLSRI